MRQNSVFRTRGLRNMMVPTIFGMIVRGVMPVDNGPEPWFTSAAHNDEDVATTPAAFEGSLSDVLRWESSTARVLRPLQDSGSAGKLAGSPSSGRLCRSARKARSVSNAMGGRTSMAK